MLRSARNPFVSVSVREQQRLMTFPPPDDLNITWSVAYFYADHVAPLNPIVLPSQARAYHTLPEPLLYAILGVAALHREVPIMLVLQIRAKLDLLLLDGVEKTSSMANIQTILVACMSHVCRLLSFLHIDTC
jgi:hypothetical protein